MNGILKGKKILITGASSGIGKAMALFFSEQGAVVIINGRNEERLNETLLTLKGEDNIKVAAELSNVESLKEMMDYIYTNVGELDGVVHCAGVQITLPLQALREKHYDSIFSSNVKSAHFLAKELRRKGRYNPNGASLIFISSVAATCGEPSNATYASSKAALEGLSRSLAVELARNNIRVNCISPGLVQTEMSANITKHFTQEQGDKIVAKHPLGLGRPEDIAHAAAFLSSNYSRWITGSVMSVDGGYSIN